MPSEMHHLAEHARLLLNRGGTVESGLQQGEVDDEALTDALLEAMQRDRIGPLATALESAGPDPAWLAATEAVRRARLALARIEGGASPSGLDDAEVSALEVIVHSVGRPAMRYRNGTVLRPTNEIADNAAWHHLVTLQRDRINRLSSRVGRIACEHGGRGSVEGTGWRVGVDRIVTNHHVLVLSGLISGGDRAEVPAFATGKKPFVDFDYTDDTAGPSSFRIIGPVYANVDLDLAILRIDPGIAEPPPGLEIAWDKESLGSVNANGVFHGAQVYAVGHPYHRHATADIAGVFGMGQIDGRKRFAPGYVTGFVDGMPVIRHDCSTLAGNSGSCIVATNTAGDHAAVGLHFGGPADAARTGFGPTNYATAFALIAGLPAAQYLK
jgi:hypothetical protein